MEKTTAKITKIEKFTAIIDLIEGREFFVDAGELVAFCKAEIESIAKKAAKAKERKAEKAKAADPLVDAIVAALTDEAQTLADITEAVAETDPEVSVAKVRYRLTQLEKEGVAVKSEVSIKEEGQKARKLVAYALAEVEVEAE